MPFTHFWDEGVEVVNRARNGRSTRTFLSEGLWASIQSELCEGDYVFIQFGHNDESPEKADRYTTVEEYRTNLGQFIRDVRMRKGIPILLTPVGRRRFNEQGMVQESHARYSAAVRSVAEREAVVCIDADSLSRRLYQTFGAEGTRMLFLQLAPGEHPNYPSGKEDNTHFNELGARLIAQLVLAEIRRRLPELARHVVQSVR
jgi:lysophospholipase L1-like esterase